jgi:hypothetical protein
MRHARRLGWAVAALALIATASATAGAEGRPTASVSETSPSFPGVNPRGLEGSWGTAVVSRADLLDHAVLEGARRRCAADFLTAAGVTRTLRWQLYLRDGQWWLFGEVDGAPPADFDAGTYTRFMTGEWAEFTSVGPTVTDDSWLVPTLRGSHLTMDFNSLTQWRPEPDSTCFLKAATIIQLTNPFTRTS